MRNLPNKCEWHLIRFPVAYVQMDREMKAVAYLERFPTHELHGDEVNPVVFLDGVHRDDVRVIERGDRFRFALETFPPCLGFAELDLRPLKQGRWIRAPLPLRPA